jgi:hypothetical protein
MSNLNTAMLDDRIPLEAADAIERGDFPPHPYHALEALRYTTFTLGDAHLWIALLGAQRATWPWGDEELDSETAAQKLRALATATTEADLEAAFGLRYKQAIWFVRQIPYKPLTLQPTSTKQRSIIALRWCSSPTRNERWAQRRSGQQRSKPHGSCPPASAGKLT